MKIFVVLIVALMSLQSFACDVCGGIVAPGTMGLLPDNQYHFFGFKTNYSTYSSFHTDHFTQENRSSEEQFFSWTAIGRWQFSKRFGLQAELPIVWNSQSYSDGEQQSQSGLGDLRLRSNILCINRKNADKNTALILRSNIGVKLPTGPYSRDAWETNNLYPGSGSIDFLAGTNFTFRKKKIGILQENSFVYTTQNKVGYKYGHAFLGRLSGFYRHTINASYLIPSAGLNYQFTGTDRIQDIDVAQLFNSGHLLNAEIGLNFIHKKWMLNTKVAYPLYQSIGNDEVKSKGSVELGIFYLIQKK